MVPIRASFAEVALSSVPSLPYPRLHLLCVSATGELQGEDLQMQVLDIFRVDELVLLHDSCLLYFLILMLSLWSMPVLQCSCYVLIFSRRVILGIT